MIHFTIGKTTIKFEWKLTNESKCNIHNRRYTKYCELCYQNKSWKCEKEKHQQHKIFKYLILFSLKIISIQIINLKKKKMRLMKL